MNIENELTKMLQEELSKALKQTPIGYDKINDAYHIGDGVFVNENQWAEYSTAKKTYPELTPKEFQLAELSKIYDKFKKEKNAPTQPVEFDASEKHAKDMDFREILNLLDEKEYQSVVFKKVEKPFDSWEQFFDECAAGQEIHKQWMGMHEFTFIWRGKERYPFAYAFPKTEKENGYYFYTQL